MLTNIVSIKVKYSLVSWCRSHLKRITDLQAPPASPEGLGAPVPQVWSEKATGQVRFVDLYHLRARLSSCMICEIHRSNWGHRCLPHFPFHYGSMLIRSFFKILISNRHSTCHQNLLHHASNPAFSCKVLVLCMQDFFSWHDRPLSP